MTDLAPASHAPSPSAPSAVPASKKPSRFNLWFVGILGLLFVTGSIAALIWGEVRAVSVQRTLAEGGRLVQEASVERVQAVQDGRLVHVSGPARIPGTLVDPAFPTVSAAHAAKLQRVVETYSWHEHRNSSKDGGPRYSYSQDWSEEVEDSLRFDSRYGHENAPPEFASLEQVAADVQVGARRVTVAVLAGLEAGEAIVPSTSVRAGAQVVDGTLYLSGRPDTPRNGDQRVRWRTVRPSVLSVVAGQNGDELVPYRASTGREVNLVVARDASAASLLREAQERGDQEAWWWRLWCGVFASLGFLFLLLPLSAFGRRLPLLGPLAGMSASIAGFVWLLLMSVALSAVITALLAGASLLAMGDVAGAGTMVALLAAGLVLIRWHRRQARRQAAVPA